MSLWKFIQIGAAKMLKSLRWQEDLVLSVKIEEGMYVVAQMRK